MNKDKKSISFITTAPVFDQISDYDIKGRLLIFPIFGNGKAVLTQSKYLSFKYHLNSTGTQMLKVDNGKNKVI